MPADVLQILSQHSARIEREFETILAQFPAAPRRLIEAMNYSLRGGGKRIRPALVIEAHRACGGEEMMNDECGTMNQNAPDSSSIHHSSLIAHHSAVAAAAAIELIHTFSLVHDDLPAMDDDDLRRGRPTNHKVFGEAMAILAGDAMMTIAFEYLARKYESDVAIKLIAELAAAAGPVGMIGGQVLDIDGENQSVSLEQLQQIHRMKTGALLRCSCRLGAITAGANEAQLNALTEFGEHLGLAFQIVDDVLDVTATPAQLGKATNKDAHRGKNTYPAMLGLEKSRKTADKQLALAIESLARFSGAADSLRSVARFVVQRSV